MTVTPRCLACNHPAPPHALICPLCAHRAATNLSVIPADYARLDTRLGSAGPDGGRAPAGFGSRPPLRVDVLTLQAAPADAVTARALRVVDELVAPDPDSALRARADDAAPVLVAVGRWADLAREYDTLPRLVGPRTVTGECARLAGAFDALRSQWWVGDMIRDLDRTAHRLRRALGEADPPAVPIGWCPQIVDDRRYDHERLADELGARLADMAADAHGWRCGGRVRARLTADHAVCARCRQVWRGEDAIDQLGAQLGDAMIDLAGLRRYLDDPSLSVVGLRQWAHRDHWRSERIGRRTVYALADARDSWWTRRGVRGVTLGSQERASA